MQNELFKPEPQKIEVTEENFLQLDPYLTQIGYFSVEERGQIRSLSKSLTVRIKGNDIQVELNALDKYDLPRTADLDKYLAFVKILYSRVRRFGELQNPISLQNKELLREIKYKPKYSVNEYKRLKEWFGRLRSTEIVCNNVSHGDSPDLTLMTSVFHRVAMRGDRYENETLTTNLIWVDEILLQKFNRHEMMPLDYEGYKLLKKPTAKNLVPLLSKWLFSARHQDRFEKNYEDLSDLLGNVKYHRLSDIKKQLYPGLEDLRVNGWIESYGIERNLRNDYKVCLKQGERFRQILAFQEGKRAFAVVPVDPGKVSLPSSLPASPPSPPPAPLQLLKPDLRSQPPTRSKSKFSYDQWIAYANSQSNLNNPFGFANKAFTGGESDHILEFIEAEQNRSSSPSSGLTAAEIKEIIRFCPQCFGSGQEIVVGKGARECLHTLLTAVILQQACDDGDLEKDLTSRYLSQFYPPN